MALTVEIARDRVAACAQSLKSENGTGRAGAPSTAARGTGVVPSCPFAAEVDDQGTQTVLTLHLQIKRHDGKRVLLSPEGHDLCTTVAPDGHYVPRAHLVRAIGLAFAWRDQLLRTRATVESIAQLAGVTDARVHSLLMLTQLSPTLLRSVLTGTLGASITLADLLGAAQQLDWSRQARLLGR